MLKPEVCSNDTTSARRRRWQAVFPLLAVGMVACSDSGPPTPGSLLVKTETVGFMKAAQYELVVAGVSGGTVGANDEVTIPGLDPGSYVVDLTDVPDNCSAESATVSVESKATAEVVLSVNCTYAAPVSYTVQFTRQRPDLDTGEVVVCPFGVCASQEAWDFWVENNIQTQPRSHIRQNQTTGVEIAHLPGVTLDVLTEEDLASASFTTNKVDEPFSSSRVILVRTDLGNVYALGSPIEDVTNGTVTFQAALIATP
jgi:hypothetical protein